ncbi:DegT/DnrJ/EryC1/StrS family aminotransferase [Streptomyces sp. NBC_00249]|uniref:DegT/DnrJ/EryC1/StrS family aminotransferase n=1 Tax=Streptomyces sp. NBC_00249 TaxID=2975690 RepID=UPI0022586525|nr:DegT/DnrJ/EryC1/StrS family aminotransferase [Streptomyces sp. NBC_00249]MCX5192910.1 DegT/DnrJ/EryC1/StrS family aminotransferase [Streptomyces sp. NBC_00249]
MIRGRPCAVDQLAKVAADHGLKLVHDAAHGLGCTSGGRPIGGFGHAEVFSFHATKVVNAFEGGAVVTGVHRDLLGDVLKSENVVCQRYFSPGCHEMEPYRSERTVTLPHTERRLAQKVLALPTGPTVSREDIRRVCDIVRLTVERGHEVTGLGNGRGGHLGRGCRGGELGRNLSRKLDVAVRPGGLLRRGRRALLVLALLPLGTERAERPQRVVVGVSAVTGLRGSRRRRHGVVGAFRVGADRKRLNSRDPSF